MITSNAAELAAKNRLRATRFLQNSEAAGRQNMAEMKRKAVELSSATSYNPKSDRTRPYSRSSPHPPLPPQFVNVQSGQFREGWRTEIRHEAGNFVGELSNSTPHARFFGGEATKNMIGRPILQAVNTAERAPCYRRFVEAERKAWR